MVVNGINECYDQLRALRINVPHVDEIDQQESLVYLGKSIAKDRKKKLQEEMTSFSELRDLLRKQVMKDPPTTRVIEIPAEYKTVAVRKLVTPAEVTSTPIPETYQTISRTEKVTDGRMEWQSILCETNAKPGVVSSLQQALKNAGHDPGPIDGVIGVRTMGAVKSYQRAKGLPEGQLTMDTLNSLGVKF